MAMRIPKENFPYNYNLTHLFKPNFYDQVQHWKTFITYL